MSTTFVIQQEAPSVPAPIDALIRDYVAARCHVEAARMEQQCREALALHDGSPLALMIVHRPMWMDVPPAVASRWPQENP